MEQLEGMSKDAVQHRITFLIHTAKKAADRQEKQLSLQTDPHQDQPLPEEAQLESTSGPEPISTTPAVLAEPQAAYPALLSPPTQFPDNWQENPSRTVHEEIDLTG